MRPPMMKGVLLPIRANVWTSRTERLIDHRCARNRKKSYL